MTDVHVIRVLKGIAVILFGLSLSLLGSSFGPALPITGAIVAFIGMISSQYEPEKD